MRIVVHARPPLYDVRKSKADFVARLADFAFLLWIALDGYEPEPGARVTIEVALRTRCGAPRLIHLCESVVDALETLGIDPAKFDSLQYKRGKASRDHIRISFK